MIYEILEKMKGKRILVTGGTGLIGKSFIHTLLSWNEKADTPISIITVVRDKKKVEKEFGEDRSNLKILVGDIRHIDFGNIRVDYILHAASQTSSCAFVNNPVETISIAIDGTRHLLNYAKSQKIEKFIYLSSMEVYGTPQTDEVITEEHPTNLDTMKVRSCYPISKRMCENICVSYAAEYNVPINILRLTQTFGPGVEYDDERVFAEFARCVIENKDIILKTKGETKRSYLYTEDAINAILTVMCNGTVNEVYNVANEDTYCSIYEMALLVTEKIAGGKIKVRVEEDKSVLKFASTLHMNLSVRKLEKLNWKATLSLEDMYKIMIDDMKRNM